MTTECSRNEKLDLMAENPNSSRATMLINDLKKTIVS